MKFVLARVENFVGKGENAGYQHFLHFPQCFKCFKTLYVQDLLKSGLCGKEFRFFVVKFFETEKTESEHSVLSNL